MNDRVQPFTEALKKAGLKLTPQRLAIIKCMAGNESHPTAQQIHQRLQKSHPTMAVATIYNTLSSLTAIGACRELEIEGPTRFDPNLTPHHHAVCDTCGSVRDVAVGSTGSTTTRPPLPGFHVQYVEKIFRGTCQGCRLKSKKKK